MNDTHKKISIVYALKTQFLSEIPNNSDTHTPILYGAISIRKNIKTL